MTAPTRVLDLSTGIAGAYCTKLLADAGCDVVKVEPAGGDPLRRWSASGPLADGEEGPLSRFLAGGKRRLAAPDDLGDLVAAADVIVTGPAVVERPATAREDAVRVAITPWGSTGPWVGRPWSEFVVQAESGSIGGRGVPGREPFQAGGRTTEYAAGTYAALGALAAAREARRSGHGEDVDVALLGVATIVAANYGDLGRRLAGTDVTAIPAQSIETPSIEPTLDGYVGFTTNSRQQFDDFLVLIERGDLLGDDTLAGIRGRLANLDTWTAAVHAWTRRHATAEIVARAADLRIPVAPLGNGQTVAEQEAFTGRGVFDTDPVTGHRRPRRPFRLDSEPVPPWTPPLDVGGVDWAPRPGRAATDRRLPLAGIRILDLTAWWAGPACTHALATLGADVVHVESLARPDGMRMAGGALLGRVEAWWEHSAFFLAANNNKRGVTIDFSTEEGRALLERLVSSCDAVVENFTPRVLENVGLGWDRIRELNPAAVLLRMPAFGLDGPWRDRPGFAQTMEQLSGLAWVTGHVDDQPRIQRGPCDPIAGMHAALAFVAALDRAGGCHVEATMVEAALNIAAEQLLEHEAHGVVLERDGNRSPGAAPQGLFPTADGSLLAVSVLDDEQWDALVGVVGPPPGDAPSTAAARAERQDELEAWLRAWAASGAVDDLVDRLVAAGVPAGRVRDPRLGSEHPQLVATGLYEVVDHPAAGAHPTPTVPFRYRSVDRWTRCPAPTVGQHNREVLTELAGLGDAEVDALEAHGRIGTRPTGL